MHNGLINAWSKITRLSLYCVSLSFIAFFPIDPLTAKVPCYDLTGCCPPNPGSLSVTCTIFGCHPCNGTTPIAGCPSKGSNPDCEAVFLEPCYKPRVKYHKKRKVRRIKEAVEIIEVMPPCREPLKRVRLCPPLTEELLKCKAIFPGDLQDNLCANFKEKLKICEPAVCYAPYAQDPTFKTTWEIHGINAGRCVVSSTYEDIGLRDRKARPIPVTLTCEYDSVGIHALLKKFDDMDRRYYHFTTCERGDGIHNCTLTSKGKPIQKVKLQQ